MEQVTQSQVHIKLTKIHDFYDKKLLVSIFLMDKTCEYSLSYLSVKNGNIMLFYGTCMAGYSLFFVL